MTEDRWNEIERLLDEAGARPGAERAAFLDVACPDGALRAEVEALLAADAEATVFFATLGEALAQEALSADPALGTTLGRWRLVERIGRGGSGTVYRAERADGVVAQTAALKLLDTMRPDVVARFARERQILARLDHPSIARLLDGGATPEGRPYLVMEFVDGMPITDYAAHHRLPVEDRLALFDEVCGAVQAAHQRLVVHRDLKPSNVFITGEGRVKLLDFGIAHLLGAEDDPNAAALLTQTDQRLLTPEYAAPEQVCGGAITTATDVYALGVLLYELLTGTRPFALPQRLLHEVARVIVEEQPARPSTAVTRPGGHALTMPHHALQRRLAGDLDQICLKALRKAPARRYATAEALGRDVRRHLDGLPVEARPDSVSYRFTRYMRRHRQGLAVATLLLAAAAAFGVWHVERLRTERDRAARLAAYTIDLFTAVDPLEAEPLPPDVPFADVLRLASERAARDLDGTDRFEMLRVLGRTRRSLGDTAAYAFAQQVQAQALRDFGPRSLPHAQATTDLAWVAQGYEPPGVTDSLYRVALRLHEAHAGRDPAGLASTHSDYGFFLKQDVTRYDEAEHHLARAVSAYREAGEAQRENLATALQHYATVLASQGNAAEAQAVIDEALALNIVLYGEAHANVGVALANAALVAVERGDRAEVVRLNRAALEVFAGAGLPDDYGIALSVLGNLAVNTTDPREAVRLHRRILAAHEANGRTDEDHPRVLQNLGVALQKAAVPDSAIAMLRRARTAYLASPEAKTYRASLPLLTLARMHLESGQPAEAQAQARQASEELTARLGDAHWIAHYARGLHAWADLEAGQPGAAGRLRVALDALADEPRSAVHRGALRAAAERLGVE